MYTTRDDGNRKLTQQEPAPLAVQLPPADSLIFGANLISHLNLNEDDA